MIFCTDFLPSSSTQNQCKTAQIKTKSAQIRFQNWLNYSKLVQIKSKCPNYRKAMQVITKSAQIRFQNCPNYSKTAQTKYPNYSETAQICGKEVPKLEFKTAKIRASQPKVK